jgi:hypothetical protein
MRITVHTNDDGFHELKEQAHKKGISMAKLFDQAVRPGCRLSRMVEPRVSPIVRNGSARGVPVID